jgi:hypothetical protein
VKLAIEKTLKKAFNTILFLKKLKNLAPRLAFNSKRDAEIQTILLCWSRMLRNHCCRLKKRVKEANRLQKSRVKEAKIKKKRKKNTLSYRRKSLLGAVHESH